MRKVILFLFILFFPLFLHAGPKSNTKPNVEVVSSEVNVDLNQTFMLEVNQKAVLKGEALNIFAVEVMDDLCKEGLDCSEGSMSIHLVVSKGNEKKEILLTTRDSRRPLKPEIKEVFGYKIQLIEMGESAALLVIRK